MESAARLFFTSPRFAVVGASQDTQKYGFKGLMCVWIQRNFAEYCLIAVLAWYHAHSLPVHPINPSRPAITVSSTVYQTLSSPSALPFPTETSLSIITQPSVTLQVLRDAKAAGISAVWLQPGSFDDEGLDYAKKEFAAGVGGDGGRGSSGWCILVDGHSALQEAQKCQHHERL